MSSPRSPAKSSSPVFLHQHAEDNLKYIRNAMESAVSFTGVSGKGYVLAGVSALIAGWLAAQQPGATAWLVVWMAELVIAATVALAMTAFKARSQGSSLWSSNGIKLLLAFLPSMVAGGIFTLALYLQNTISLLPGIWMCLYGAAVMTAGVHSVRVIPIMGALFILLGAAVLLSPLPANTTLSLGMGLLHIVFGIIIWKNHGG
ncbi:MAG: hypothetical protein V4628_14515 [Pseudomonadota bacterium]